MSYKQMVVDTILVISIIGMVLWLTFSGTQQVPRTDYLVNKLADQLVGVDGDCYGTKLKIEQTSEFVRITSAGKDCEFGTEDDVIRSKIKAVHSD